LKEVSLKRFRKNKPVKLNLIPPNADAVEMYLLRVYYQIQKWLGNVLNPIDWGWILRKGVLVPRKMLQFLAPDCLLCKKGCGALCGCQQPGLALSSLR